MCLAIPMKVIEVKGTSGVVGAGNIRREVDLQFLDKVSIGDYVIVHAGFAIQKLDEEDALETLEIFKEMEEIENQKEGE